MTVISVGAFGGVAVPAGLAVPAPVGVAGALALLTACAVPARRQRSAARAAGGASAW